MQTTLSNTYRPTLIATILKARREQLKENELIECRRRDCKSVRDILIEYEQILKGGEGFLARVIG